MNIFKLSNKELEEYLKNNIDIKGPNELLQELIECGLRGEKMEKIVETEKIVDDKIIEEMNLLYEYNRKTYYRNEIKKSIARLICLIVLFILTLFLVRVEDGFYKTINIISLIGQVVMMILHAVDIEKDLDKLADIPELPEHLKFGTLSNKERAKILLNKRFK